MLLGLTEHGVWPVTAIPPSQQVAEPSGRAALDRQVTARHAKRVGDAELRQNKRKAKVRGAQGWMPSFLGIVNFPPSFQTSDDQDRRCLLMLRGYYGDEYLACLQLCGRISVNLDDGDQPNERD